MIRLEHVTKRFHLGGDLYKSVAEDISITFPSCRSVALLGGNGAGKSTLLQMIAGNISPDSGRIIREGTVSWPVGFAGSFHGDLSGSQNTKFVARIYGIDTESLRGFVEDFSGLGAHFYMPVRTYSSGMKSRLAFGISVGIPFDFYLVDEVTSVGDASFKRKSEIVFHERMRASGAIVVSHSVGQLRKLCDSGAVLDSGKLFFYDNLEHAIDHHQSNMAG